MIYLRRSVLKIKFLKIPPQNCRLKSEHGILHSENEAFPWLPKLLPHQHSALYKCFNLFKKNTLFLLIYKMNTLNEQFSSVFVKKQKIQ